MSAPGTKATCATCPHACTLAEGQLGLCRARRNVGGVVTCENYGRLTSVAVDPVEKKPLAEFHPECTLLSVGSYGCNLRCPFCQNYEISQAGPDDIGWREASPAKLVELALRCRAEDPRMIGIAHTYNEPLVGWEYVRDCSLLARERGLVNVLVSNGCASSAVIDELAPLIDAANIDLKSFSPAFYQTCGGDLETVRSTIARLAAEPSCHLEVTTLVVPGMNDGDDEMRALASWLAGLSPDIVLHVTRFFPRWKMSNAHPTPVETVHRLADVAREKLSHVYVGNC